MQLSFYHIDPSYCNMLQRLDPRVPNIQNQKLNRPFVGVVLKVNGLNYYAPLTSPKHKHLTMRDQIDFMKIQDGQYGAINFNNMIPVPQEKLTLVDTQICQDNTPAERAYKKLLFKQWKWCRANAGEIAKHAELLWNIVIHNAGSDRLQKRCCDWRLLELACRESMLLDVRLEDQIVFKL